MMGFLRELIAKDDTVVDPIVFQAIIGFFAFLGFTAAAVVWLHQPWSGMDFAFALAAIIGIPASIKGGRDYWVKPSPTPPPSETK